MTSTRSYRKALDHEVAISEIERCSGTQFDPNYAKVFISIADVIAKAKESPDEYYRKYSCMSEYFDKEDGEKPEETSGEQ